uniref:Uncharacterized protein n=1 Tax=Ananas comosus var. bracteatus TaxID=296719 RepID=A0A6V7Q3F2_ANACO|nr:unnamed protein product [Ananas comosus var. bracteatus]
MPPETFWKVVDSVPTYGSHPENCGFKLVPKAQKDWTLVSSWVACSRACTGTRLVLYRYKVDGCTGTAIGLVSVQSRRPRNPSLGFAFSWALYRYKGPCTGSLPTSRHSGDSHRDSYSPCGIGRRSGLPWARLIPRVGMMTTTGPLGSASARQPTGGSQGHRQPSGGAFCTGGGTGSQQGDRIAN